MISNYLEAIRSRKNFYRDNYRRATSALLVMMIIICCLIVAIIYVYFTQPPKDYYASNNAGGLAKLTPLNKPNMSATPLIN